MGALPGLQGAIDELYLVPGLEDPVRKRQSPEMEKMVSEI